MSIVVEEKWHLRTFDLNLLEDEQGSPNECCPEEVDASKALTPRYRVRGPTHSLQLTMNSALKRDQTCSVLLELISGANAIFRRSTSWRGRLNEHSEKNVVWTTATSRFTKRAFLAFHCYQRISIIKCRLFNSSWHPPSSYICGRSGSWRWVR